VLSFASPSTFSPISHPLSCQGQLSLSSGSSALLPITLADPRVSPAMLQPLPLPCPADPQLPGGFPQHPSQTTLPWKESRLLTTWNEVQTPYPTASLGHDSEDLLGAGWLLMSLAHMTFT
jgi:hypothetical protein